MTSAVASNLVPAAPAASAYGCRRASFGRDAHAPEETAPAAVVVVSSASPVHPAVAAPAISKDFIDFEFSLGGGGCAASMLPADELFADGKLLPLRRADADTAATAAAPEPEAAAATAPPARLLEAMPASPEPMRPIRGGAAAGAADQYVFSPKAPSCSSRWRELLGLKRAAAAQSPKSTPSQSQSPSPAAALAKTPGRTTATTGSSAARSLKFLLQRSNGGRASTGTASDLASAPLLRDSSDSEASLSLASSRFSHSSSSSSSGHDHDDVNPRFSLDSAADPNPPRLRLVRSSHRHSTSSRAAHSPARRRPSPPRQQDASRCLSVDSPRMNSSGKIVFQQGLERSCSSPCSLHAAARSRSMARAVDRSYSSGVRVAPVVLNVPVCSRPVFGFFKDKKESAASKDSSSSARSSSRASTLGRKQTPTPTAAQRWSGELPRPCG
ncbi:suppressor protein SRP40-like [Hordeum vulgare subsp. vulgare]|uniref:Predicted protein n=1 Tax=Hordeum vulgare subsp. vulgare TaxID=112509 RepID=F2ELV8_HORVV|nr:suppressor protein SRP40-like [Hordeum vulgare subsp. vulgare]BAK08330.1 predicted protein [Hordeum vulgare subsp. vulgare]